MDIRDSETLIESFKKKPWMTISAIVVLLILLSVIAWVNGFFGEKGKRAASLPKDTPHMEQPSKDLPHQRKKPESSPTISQHTEGDQAPIVNVGPGGQSTINYGAPKGRQASE
jgi:hypothetical protein